MYLRMLMKFDAGRYVISSKDKLSSLTFVEISDPMLEFSEQQI